MQGSSKRGGCRRRVGVALLTAVAVGVAVWAEGRIDEALWLADRVWTADELDRLAGAPAAGPIEDFDFVVVSDLHFGKWNEERAAGLLAAAPRIEGRPAGDGTAFGRPRFLATCGDNIDNGEGGDAPAEYARFRAAAAATGLPIYFVVGNHDVMGPKDVARGLRAEPYAGGEMHYAFEVGGVHFLALAYYTDQGSDYPAAALGEAQRRWLKDRLAAIGTRAPIVVLLHPLPARFDEVWFMPGWISLDRREERLLTALTGPFRVVAFVFGHFHRQFVSEWAGAAAVCVGSVTHDSPRPLVVGHVRSGRLSFLALDPADVDAGPAVLVEPIDLSPR